MAGKEYTKMSMDGFKENWPTPPESMTRLDTNNTVCASQREYSNIQQLQRQPELQMDISQRIQGSIDTKGGNWPTPAKSMTGQDMNNLSADCDVEYSNIRQLERQTELQMDISFLQPSVVYLSPQPDDYGSILHSTSDKGDNIDIAAQNPNIHIWGKTLEEEMDIGKQMHPTVLSQLKPCKTTGSDHNFTMFYQT